MTDPKCQDCGRDLLIPYDWSGTGREVVVCFACDPPRILCRACSNLHACPAPTSGRASPKDEPMPMLSAKPGSKLASQPTKPPDTFAPGSVP